MAAVITTDRRFLLHRARKTATKAWRTASAPVTSCFGVDRAGAPPHRAAHAVASFLAVILILQAALVAAGSLTLSHDRSWTGTVILVGLQLVAITFYSAYYVPALSCLMLFIESFGAAQPLADMRYLVLLPGALAGGAYVAASIWWRKRLHRLPPRARDLERIGAAGDGLFEIGKRYLAAWLLVFVIDEVAPLLGGQFGETEHAVAEAGGVIVLIDLIALFSGRIRASYASLASAAQSRPQPRRDGKSLFQN